MKNRQDQGKGLGVCPSSAPATACSCLGNGLQADAVGELFVSINSNVKCSVNLDFASLRCDKRVIGFLDVWVSQNSVNVSQQWCSVSRLPLPVKGQSNSRDRKTVVEFSLHAKSGGWN